MGTEKLFELLYQQDLTDFERRHEEAFHNLFGSPHGRYSQAASKTVKHRFNTQDFSSGVPFAAYIHMDSPDRGGYGGTSFVVFPSKESPALFGFVVGTQGLSPDHEILSRPGHARNARAICDWLQANATAPYTAWSKHDPTRTDLGLPKDVAEAWSPFAAAVEKYGNCLYAMYRANEDKAATQTALHALLDFYFRERGQDVLNSQSKTAEPIRSAWSAHIMPRVEKEEIADLLKTRKYVVVQGPPGCGKTHLALELMQTYYHGNGKSIQFHPSTTYETFVGGLAPESTASELGLRFAPKPGALMEAARAARKNPEKNYLLHIDEINRADLAKVLGEAIFLLEAHARNPRTISLAYHFGPDFGRELSLPPNLHILGTMNSADRSIAIVDVAVRRRFGFVSLWPRPEVVSQLGSPVMQEAFQRLQRLFIDYASDDALALLPGHAYFLAEDDETARKHLKTNLQPLLEEYLAQGYVSNFSESIRTYLQ
ncbi:MAG: AAA family ATPase [Bryobacter sp.]|nr:AAA family ATPase [Bryobacter sp.]